MGRPVASLRARLRRRQGEGREMTAVDISANHDMITGMKELVSAAKALADPSRIRILMALREQELCVCEISDALDLTQSTLSTHLQVARRAGVVRARRAGKWSYYSIAPKARGFFEAAAVCFSESLAGDRVLRKDAAKLKRRLALRDNGACCVGFGSGACCAPGSK